MRKYQKPFTHLSLHQILSTNFNTTKKLTCASKLIANKMVTFFYYNSYEISRISRNEFCSLYNSSKLSSKLRHNIKYLTSFAYITTFHIIALLPYIGSGRRSGPIRTIINRIDPWAKTCRSQVKHKRKR